MSKTFDILSASLGEAIADTKEKNLSRRTRTMDIPPIPVYSSKEIKNIRQQIGFTQALFAKYFGVSLKTVEAWESGRNKPSGPSNRLLNLIHTKRISF